MHEQLLHRILRDASKALDAMKAKRTAARQTALGAARAQHNPNKMPGVSGLPNETPLSVGFVLTTARNSTKTSPPGSACKATAPSRVDWCACMARTVTELYA
jgi:hypothetical protein